jgi:CBS-domain-containing membrane protein
VFTAGDIMSSNLVMASSTMDAMDVIKLMNEHHVRRVMISDDEGRLVGIITMEDILEFLANELAIFAQGMVGVRELAIDKHSEMKEIFLN